MIFRVALPLLTCLLVGCGYRGCGASDGPPEAPSETTTDVTEPPANSPGTLQLLGPQRWQSSFIRRGDRSGAFTTKDRHQEYLFGAQDSWSLVVRDDIEVIEEVRRVGAAMFRRHSTEAPWTRTAAGPPDPASLDRTLSAWDSALGPFEAQIAWQKAGTETLEERVTTLWLMSLAPAPAEGEGGAGPGLDAVRHGRTTLAVALEGKLWIDDLTGNRLKGSFVGRFLPLTAAGSTDAADEVVVEYEEQRTSLGAAPAIVIPEGDRILDRSATRPPIEGPLKRPAGSR